MPHHEGHLPGRHRWLCVAYAFPPVLRSGTHRTLGFVRHLDRLGWGTSVLTAAATNETTDASLLPWVPTSTTVVRTAAGHPAGRWRASVLDVGKHPRSGTADRAAARGPAPGDGAPCRSRWRRAITAALATPDSRIGWILPAVRAGLREVRRHPPELIFSTSPYASAHLIAAVVARWTRRPWVADFRDPWSGNPFSSREFPALARFDAWLERLVLERADRIVLATPTMSRRIRCRFPHLAAKCRTILNGFDHERLAAIQPARTAPVDHVVLTHAGQFYGPRRPHVWFAALRRVLEQAPALRRKLYLQLIGPPQFAGRSLEEWARDAGVSDNVQVLGTLGHTATLSRLAGSDGLILASAEGPGSDLQVPNKLFEYLGLRRPILAACSPESPIVPILHEARAEAWVCTRGDVAELADSMRGLAEKRGIVGAGAWRGADRFERRHRAAELLELFEQLTSRTRSAARRANGTVAAYPTSVGSPAFGHS